MAKQSRAQKYYELLAFNVGRDAQQFPESAIERRYGVTRGFVRYWAEKYANPLFHSGERGGAQNNLFTPAAQLLVEGVLWQLVEENCFRSKTTYARRLRNLGIDVDRRFICVVGVCVMSSVQFFTKSTRLFNANSFCFSL